MNSVIDVEAGVATGGRERANLRYAWYVVLVLMVAYTLSFIDRQILSLLVQPVKAELQISDTQIGLLQGLAFALFYTILGLPMGWIVDRYNRRNLIVAGISLWSVMTALCGAAGNFGMLFLARMGVGVGEATLSPAALSIITDYFPKERLGTALSVYSMGIFFGSGLAFLVGGAVIAAVSGLPPVEVPVLGWLAPWRLTFLVVGLPGLFMAILIYTLREPHRTGALLTKDGSVATLSLRQSLREVQARWQSFAGIAGGMALHAICMYGFFAWMPTFFIRTHHWTAGQAGLWLGLIVLLFGCSGMYVGGRICDHWRAQGRQAAPMRVGFVGALLAAFSLVAAVTVSSPATSLALLAPAVFALALPIGSLFAALQLIIPNQVRGQISALYLFVISLAGISLGPLIPGLLNDRVYHDATRIGDSLAITMGLAAVFMALIFRMTYASYHRHAQRAQSHSPVFR